MNFDIFLKSVSKIANLPLPGQASHYKMAPPNRIEELKAAKQLNIKPRKAAVLMLFYPDAKEQTRFSLILRKTYKGVHSNQVAFPGGKIEDADKNNLQVTALRETHEEIGVPPHDVELIRGISEVYIPPSNFLVAPFLGFTKAVPVFKAQEEEVEEIIEILLSDFINYGKTQNEQLATSSAESIEVPVFRLNGYTIWGATAMMLNEVKELLKKVY